MSRFKLENTADVAFHMYRNEFVSSWNTVMGKITFSFLFLPMASLICNEDWLGMTNVEDGKHLDKVKQFIFIFHWSQSKMRLNPHLIHLSRIELI